MLTMQHNCVNVLYRHGRSTRPQSSQAAAARHAEVAEPLRLRAQLYRKTASPNALGSYRQNRSGTQRRRAPTCSATSTAVGVGIFFTPSIIAVIYAYFKGKGNVKDGLSRLLTEVTQGYFQPNVGGESIPVAQGELSDLAGDEPLFKALYQW